VVFGTDVLGSNQKVGADGPVSIVANIGSFRKKACPIPEEENLKTTIEEA
jgi:hypothetical protein